MIPNASGIYRIDHFTSGRVYIGSAANLRNRWVVHKHHLKKGSHQNQHLQRAWDKYGEGDFSFSVVELIQEKSDLVAREQHWIESCVKSHKLFNIVMTAGSSLGRKFSQASREKMSRAATGRKASDEARGRMSAARKNKPLPHMEKIVAANKLRAGIKMSPEARDKMSQAAKLRVARDPRRGADGQFIGAPRSVTFKE